MADLDRDEEDALAAFVLQEAPGHLMRRCQQIAVELYAEEVGEDGPTPRQFAVLHSVSRRQGLNQTDLVRLTGIDRSTMAELVSRMIDRGLLDRRRTAADQRANEIRLTESGRRALLKALPGVRRAQLRILAPLPPERRGAFVRCLQILAGMVEDDGA